MRKTALMVSCALVLAVACVTASNAQEATAPADPTVKPPAGNLIALWNEINCDCECECCTRIKRLIKSRLKDPNGRPMMRPEAPRGSREGVHKSHRQRVHGFRKAKAHKAREMRERRSWHHRRFERKRYDWKRLDLTDEQRDSIEELRHERRLESIDLGAELKKRRLELRRLKRDHEVSIMALREAVDAVARARADVEFHRLKTMMDTRSLLTDEQRRKLKRHR
jgi:Spy/CpxP family protein refolding chaperone